MGNSIEEDMKILEGIIKGDEDCINAIYSQMKVKNDNDEDIQYYKKEIQSIKNIVNNYLKEKARADKLEKEYSAMLTELDEDECDYKRVLKENEHKTEKIENQKAGLAILNEKQKDLNKLQNTLSSYKGQFRRQEKENEKINSLIKKLEKDSEEQQWIQTADDEYLAHTEKAMYADELLLFLRGEE